MKLPQVEVIRTRPLEALVEKVKRSVAGSVVGLRGQKNLAATLTEGGPVIIEATGIGGRRVAVGHPQVERAVDDGYCLIRAAVGAQHPFATQGKLGHLLARAPKETAWNQPGGSLADTGTCGEPRCSWWCGHALFSEGEAGWCEVMLRGRIT